MWDKARAALLPAKLPTASELLQVFPEPWWVRWDSYAELCALGYADEVIVCQCRPRMQRIASLSVSGVSSAAWGTRQLFLSSQDGLDLAFVDRGTSQEENYDASPSSTPELPAPPLLPVLQVPELNGPLSASSPLFSCAYSALLLRP